MRRKYFIWLILPGHSTSLMEVIAEIEAGAGKLARELILDSGLSQNRAKLQQVAVL